MGLEVAAPPPTQALFGIMQEKGFDTCAAPSKATMATWWTGSPYFTIGIYIGGSSRGCAQPNLTQSWILDVQVTHGDWALLPIWVGRQMPNPQCQNIHNYSNEISLNTTTAFNQGHDEALAAFSAALALDLDTSELPLVYDLESYNGGSSSLTTCRNAAKAFIDGWDSFLAAGNPQKSGVYGSQCGSFLNDFRTIANPPDFIWFAYWNNNPSVYNTSSGCAIPATAWNNHERHKQYKGGHNETWGGVTIKVDNDCSDGPVYMDHDRFDSTSDCL
jgi:hypothetical protein